MGARLDLPLAQADPIAVTPPAVGDDVDVPRVGIPAPPLLLPPSRQGMHRDASAGPSGASA